MPVGSTRWRFTSRRGKEDFYYALIQELQPVARPELSLPQVRELHSHFFTCALAELEANFLLVALSQWHFRHEGIGNQLAKICTFNPRNVLHARVDVLGLARGAELRDLEEQIGTTSAVCQENWDRIQSAEHEMRHDALAGPADCAPAGQSSGIGRREFDHQVP
jgi:hypothetical protein